MINQKIPTQNKLNWDYAMWCHLDLNQGHTDFQSDALPTELWHPFKAAAKIIIFLF